MAACDCKRIGVRRDPEKRIGVERSAKEIGVGFFRTLIADLSNYYTKSETDAQIEYTAEVVARAIYDLRMAIGATEDLKMNFGGTNNFQNLSSIADVLYYLDTEFISRTELYEILNSIFNGSLYGSGGASGVAIGDFEETEEVSNEE